MNRNPATHLTHILFSIVMLAGLLLLDVVPVQTAEAQTSATVVQSALGPNLVINGNFETPDVTAITFDTYFAGASFGNWYVESGSVDHISERYWQAADGRQSVDLGGNSDGAISQYLLTSPLQSYLLIFALSGNPETSFCTYAGPIKRMEVWWGATLLDTLTFDTTGHSNWSMGWGYHQYNITATEAITKLMFKSLNSNCHGPVLDMVSVQSYSGGDIPLLDLPLELPSGRRSSDVALGNYFGGWVNSWFDHDTPDYKRTETLILWNGTKLTQTDHGGSNCRLPDGTYIPGCTNILVSNCSTKPGALGISCYDGHNGIDYQRQSHVENDVTVYDDTIYAAAPGIVVDLCDHYPCKQPDTGLNKRADGYGKWILIQHEQPYGKYATFYAHLSSIDSDIHVGTVISDHKSTPIGIMGGTGNNWPIHLHFGVYYDANGNSKWEEYSGYKDNQGVQHPAYTEAVDPYGWFGTTADPWWNKSLYLWKFPLQDQQIVDETGAVLTTPSGKGKVTIQPGIIVTPITAELWDSSIPKLPSSGFRGVGHSVWLRVLEWVTGTTNNGDLEFPHAMTNATNGTFPQPVSVNIRYGSDDAKHLNMNQLGIYWLDETSDSWIGLATTISTGLQEATAQTTKMGHFSLQAPLSCPADTQEPNDRYDASTTVQTNGSPITNLFDIALDEDWFQFDALAGNIYTLRTANLSAGVNTVLELYATDGATMIASDDNGGGGNASSLSWQAPDDGVYYVRVRRVSGSPYGCTSTYNLEITFSDAVSPAAISITRIDSNFTRSTSVDFIVNFSEVVTGVNTSLPFDDFALTTTGLIGASITDVSGSETTYAVTVNTGSGNGTIRLDVVDDNTIVDAASSPLGGVNAGDGDFASGETYSIIKTPTFGDVATNYWAWQFIERLYSAEITSGCGGGNYCPTTTVTRDQMAVFLLKGKHGSGYVPLAPTGVFTDVSTNYWAAAWIEQLAAEGITAGCGGGNFCPATSVTRDQMAVFLLKAKHGSGYGPPAPTGVFADVPTNYWAASWIEQLAAEGITAGCGGGNYCPTTPVTRDQMAVFLVKNFNLP